MIRDMEKRDYELLSGFFCITIFFYVGVKNKLVSVQMVSFLLAMLILFPIFFKVKVIEK